SRGSIRPLRLAGLRQGEARAACSGNASAPTTAASPRGKQAVLVGSRVKACPPHGRGVTMDEEHLQASAARDQLWSSLRTLLPEIEQLARGQFEDSPRERQVAQLLARIVLAELQFRREETNSD